LYNNSVGANDMAGDKKSVDEVLTNSKALLIGGSLSEPPASAGGSNGSSESFAALLGRKDFVVVQELFETETTAFADVVLPAASFAEIDGTYTNNTGFVQRVRKAIDPVYQSKPDWTITALIARAMGVDFGYDFSASAVFRAIADSVPAYAGLRYPALKDESNPAQVKHAVSAKKDLSATIDLLRQRVEDLSDSGKKNMVTPKVGHKLHRLTTMTGKTAQFHLLAHGNPKPDNLLLAPLAQFELDGTPKVNGKAEAAAVGVNDRE